MSRMYSLTFGNAAVPIAVTTATDLFEVNPAANKPCRFAGIFLSQSTDAGDAAEELLQISIVRVPATFTSSAGTSTTPRLVSATGGAAGAVCEVTTGSSAVATTSGTLEYLWSYQFNIRTGLELWLPPEFQYEFVNGAGGVVRLAAAPADSISMMGSLLLIEEG